MSALLAAGLIAGIVVSLALAEPSIASLIGRAIGVAAVVLIWATVGLASIAITTLWLIAALLGSVGIALARVWAWAADVVWLARMDGRLWIRNGRRAARRWFLAGADWAREVRRAPADRSRGW